MPAVKNHASGESATMMRMLMIDRLTATIHFLLMAALHQLGRTISSEDSSSDQSADKSKEGLEENSQDVEYHRKPCRGCLYVLGGVRRQDLLQAVQNSLNARESDETQKETDRPGDQTSQGTDLHGLLEGHTPIQPTIHPDSK